MKNAIETYDLTKVYSNNFKAVSSLNMTIPEGSIFGLLGPNGAGKTTTIKMLTCLIQPTSGKAVVGGYDVSTNPNEVRKLLGMVPQQVSLYKDLTVMENSQLCADYYGVSPDERDRVCGLIVNKFRGDKTLFDDGIKLLEEKSGIPVAGVIPFCDVKLDEEDSLTDRFRVDNAVDFSDRIDIAIIRFPRISNFTDYDVFLQCDDVSVRYVSEDSKLKEPDLVILPGTKDTLADLRWLKRSGIFDRMLDLAKKDIPIVGICGGYQMLGRLITDEKTGDLESGLDLLSVETILKGSSCKYTKQFSGAFQKCRGIFDRLSGAQITGYEIHEGVTKALDQDNIFEFTSKKSGYYSDNIYGTYIHGLFDRSEIASAIIKALGAKKGLSINTDSIVDQKQLKEENYKKLSDCLRENLDMELIKKIIT